MMIHSRPEVIHTHQTAPTRFVEANGIRFAYRRFGKPGGVPLVFNMHFTGTMDHWDPAVTDGFGNGREVILFNNAGISSSSGEVPAAVERMGANAVTFLKTLELKTVDVLGFSIGGFVAQEITLQAPELVRKLVLVGTGPRGGQGMATLTPEAQRIFWRHLCRPRRYLALRALHSVRGEPGRRPAIPQAVPAAQRKPRSRGQRESRAGADRGHRQVGRAARGLLRVPEDNQAAGAGGERFLRCDHLPDQFLHPAAEHPQRAAHPVSRLQSRRALSVSRAVRAPRLHVPRFVTRRHPWRGKQAYQQGEVT